MDNEIENVLQKVSEIDNITESQKDRLESHSLIQSELINFLSNQIQKITKKNDLRNSVIKVLDERINDEENPMSTTQLLRLFEVLSKDENDAISNILGVIKDNKGTTIQFNKNETAKSSEFTAKEVEQAKDLLGILDKVNEIKEAEMSLEEIENIEK